ncbi:hypothetical protein OSTOST_22092 [Ostertagia ostertagi]
MAEGDRCGKNDVYLLTGTAWIRHPSTNQVEEVHILLDTGADKSFIQSEFANELQLPIVRTIGLSVYTFGEKEPKQKEYTVTCMRIWDNNDQPIDLTLCKTDVISGSGKQINLSDADREYLANEQIQLSNRQGSIIRPKILLGCDQLWNLIKFPCEAHTMPSGLRIIPSRLGYLLTGQKDLEGEQASDGMCNLVQTNCEILFKTQNEAEVDSEDLENGDSDLITKVDQDYNDNQVRALRGSEEHQRKSNSELQSHKNERYNLRKRQQVCYQD